MKLFEIAMPLEKAGFIPYVIEEGKPLFLFMIPSKPNFGGPQPAIAKGAVDHYEPVIRAAIREASEELGLKESNIIENTIKLAWKGRMEGSKEIYTMSIYVGEVKDKDNFGETDHETEEVVWMTARDFAKKGRKSQVKVVNAANRLLAA